MVVAVAVVVVVVVVVIAAYAVLRESVRLTDAPQPPVFDLAEAVSWIAHRVPDDLAATLTVDDVELIVGLQLDDLRRRGLARPTGDATPVEAGLVVGPVTVEAVRRRAEEAGASYTTEQVAAVLDAQLGYLQAIGAVGREATPDEARRIEPGEPDQPGAD